MRISQVIDFVEKEVSSVPGFELPRQQAELLVAAGLQVPTSELSRLKDRPLGAEERGIIDRYLCAPTRIPVPLFLGYCEVEGIRLAVSTSGLLPGTETGAMIRLVSRMIQDHGARTIVELGAGCGVIAASLGLRHPDCRFVATEISREAAAIAHQNIAQLNVGDRVSVRIGNWYDPLSEEGLHSSVDLIISNPPYCSRDAIESLPRGFAEYAPRLAIDGGTDGLTGHRAVIEGSRDFLRAGGHLLLQTDIGQAESVSGCISEVGGFCKAEFYPGSDGGGRFVIARRIGGVS